MGRLSHASRGAIAVVAGTLAILLLSPSPAAATFNLSLDVVVLVDRPTASVGDVVNATVYVIWGGTLTDPGYINLQLNMEGVAPWSESLPVTRQSAGAYNGSFTVLANMTRATAPWVALVGTAVVSTSTGSGYAFVSVPSGPVLTSRATLSSYNAVPGQTVTGTVQTFLSGQLHDVDNLSIGAQLGTAGEPYQTSWLAVTNASIGTYRFSYTVPTGLNTSNMVHFFANAEVLALGTTFGLSPMPTLSVDVVNPFLIWVHQVAMDVTHAAFEVWVADASARPVFGATVWVHSYQPFLIRDAARFSLHALTDSSGRATFNVVLNASPPPFVGLAGSVALGSANESFSGFLTRIQGVYFDVKRDNPQDLYEPGERAFLNYTVISYGSPLAGALILYTAYNASTLLAYGRTTTDTSGVFGLNFTMPADGATIDLEVDMQNGTAQTFAVSAYAVERMDVQVGTLMLGTTAHIVGTLPEGRGPWFVSIDFHPLATSADVLGYSDWKTDGRLTGVGVHLGTQTVPGPTIDLSLPLPGFLPSGSYYLDIFAYDLGMVTPLGFVGATFEYAAIVTVQPAAVDVGLLAIVAVPIVIVVVTGVVFVLRLRKRRPPAPPAPPPTS